MVICQKFHRREPCSLCFYAPAFPSVSFYSPAEKNRGVWKQNEREYRGLKKVQRFNEAIVEKKERTRNLVAAMKPIANLKVLGRM